MTSVYATRTCAFLAALALSPLLASCTNGGASGDGWDWLRPKGGGHTPGPDEESCQIVCLRAEGPDRIPFADQMAEALKRVRGIDPGRVRVVHKPRESVITYGPYAVVTDAQGAFQMTPQLRNDLKFIRSLSVGDQSPFLQAVHERIPRPGVGPSEWDLRNASGVYTLQVGLFYNTAGFKERKEAAVEWVRDLRSRGYEAFFYHDDTKGVSGVYVGNFDDSAVIGARTTIKQRGATEVHVGGHAQDYAPHVIALMRQPEFQYTLVNMAIEKINGVPRPSILVHIPKRSAENGAGAESGM